MMKLKQWQNIFQVIVNTNSIEQHVVQNKNGIVKNVNVNVKIFLKVKKDYSLNPSTCICENSKYLKSVFDTSVTKCDKIVFVTINLSTKKTNAITTNVTTTALISFHS